MAAAGINVFTWQTSSGSGNFGTSKGWYLLNSTATTGSGSALQDTNGFQTASTIAQNTNLVVFANSPGTDNPVADLSTSGTITIQSGVTLSVYGEKPTNCAFTLDGDQISGGIIKGESSGTGTLDVESGILTLVAKDTQNAIDGSDPVGTLNVAQTGVLIGQVGNSSGDLIGGTKPGTFSVDGIVIAAKDSGALGGFGMWPTETSDTALMLGNVSGGATGAPLGVIGATGTLSGPGNMNMMNLAGTLTV